MYLETISDAMATGRVAEIFAQQRERFGKVFSTARCMTTRPDLLPAYTDFVEAVRRGFTLSMREWKLITLVAARYVPSTHCSYVYAQQLVDDLGSKEAVIAVQRDFRRAGLPVKDVEMLTYAEKVVRAPQTIERVDIERLRRAGFEDRQIMDIALCAAFRCFIGRFFDAVGAEPAAEFIDPDPSFRDPLTVGKSYAAQ